MGPSQQGPCKSLFDQMSDGLVSGLLQAALLTVEAFPGHCDCLALVNILAMKVGGPQAQAFDAEHHPTSSEEKSETCCE